MAVELGANYILEQPIGRGTFGEVWRGFVRIDRRPVAVKMLRRELAGDPSVVTRFFRERGILVGLAHPNVVSVLDLVAEGDKLGIVMQLVAGGDLRRYLEARGTLTPSDTCALLAQVAEGLAAAHAGGVVHRDLKPENVLIDTADPTIPVARITDFGVAHIADQPSLTRPSRILGTPTYVAPEVASGRSATPASDVYAIGVMAYELLCGRPPFEAEHPWGLLKLHVERAPGRPAGVPDRLWEVVAACLAKDPAQRPSASELAESLRTLAGELEGEEARPPLPRPSGAPTVPPSSETGAPARRSSGRRRVVQIGLTAVVVLSLVLVAVALRPRPRPRPPSPTPTTVVAADAVGYDFDGSLNTDAQGVNLVPDSSGHGHNGAVRTDKGGAVVVVAHPGQGNAVKFPPPCAPDPSVSCPRAIIQGPTTGDLDPGTRDFSYGADVLLMPTEVGSRLSIMQKGSGAGADASTWRLQVELAGRPSCILVAKGSGVTYRAGSQEFIGDGTWHRLRCIRTATLLTIEVDNVRGEALPIPTDTRIESDRPLRLGGNSTQQANDQFFGAMDNLFLHIGP